MKTLFLATTYWGANIAGYGMLFVVIAIALYAIFISPKYPIDPNAVLSDQDAPEETSHHPARQTQTPAQTGDTPNAKSD